MFTLVGLCPVIPEALHPPLCNCLQYTPTPPAALLPFFFHGPRFQEDFEGGKWRLLALDLAAGDQRFKARQPVPGEPSSLNLGMYRRLCRDPQHDLRNMP